MEMIEIEKLISRKNKSLNEKTIRLLPTVKYDHSNDAFIARYDDFSDVVNKTGKLMYLDIVHIVNKDWVNATDDDIQIEKLLWKKFYMTYPGDIKLITMRFRCHTYVQQKHIKDRIKLVKNELLKGELERKLEELEIIERENYERAFYLMFFGNDDIEIRRNRYSVFSILGRSIVEPIDYQTKKEIIFKLNNKNSRML